MKQRKSYNVAPSDDPSLPSPDGTGGVDDVAIISTNGDKKPKIEQFKSEEIRDDSDKVELKRSVTLMNGVGVIVGSIIGSGIFLTPTGVYRNVQHAWGAIAVWALSGVFSLIGAICFAELGTCITKSGGDYAYTMEAFGPFPAFIILWVTFLVLRPVTAAIVALTFAENVIKPFFPEENATLPNIAPQLLAAICLLLLTVINIASVRLTMKIQDVFTAGKLIALVTIIITGFVYLILYWCGVGGVDLSDNVFSVPYPSKPDEPVDPWTIPLSFYNGLFAYAGWNYLNFVTAELKDPYKNLPRAIWIGLPLVTVIYVMANIAYFIVLSPSELLESNAVAVKFGSKTFGPVQWIIPIFVALSTFGGVNGTLFSSARLFFAGAEEKQLPQVFAFVHVKRFTPVPALLFQCVIALLYLLTGELEALINYVSFVLWASTGVAVAALLWLRKTRPDIPRPIRVNLILPVLYIFFTICLVGLSVKSDPISTGIGTLITLSAVPVYLIAFVWLGKRKSKSGSKAGADSRGARITIFFQKLLSVIPQEKSETLL